MLYEMGSLENDDEMKERNKRGKEIVGVQNFCSFERRDLRKSY